MHGLMIVNKGLEDAGIRNIVELIGIKKNTIKKGDGWLRFDADFNELFKLCYLSQIANRVLIILNNVHGRNDEDVHATSKLFDDKSEKELSKIIQKDSTFRTICDIPIYGKEIEEEVGGIIADKIGLKVNLKNPDISIYIIYANNEFLLCVDLSGDLSKRDYKIFNHPLSLKGPTAFGFLMIADYHAGDSMLDTFCNSGVLQVEAALYANKISHRFYNKKFPFMKLHIPEKAFAEGFVSFFEKLDAERKNVHLPITAADSLLRNIAAVKKNAKIAGVEKYIDFRRIDTDWLDLKFEEKSIDKIITFIPGSSKHRDQKALEKLYTEFFYHAEYILKDAGDVVVLCLSKDLLMKSSPQYFTLNAEGEFYSGEQLMKVLFFKKYKKSKK
jgi:23S rRNA G2445 N2-methylase RlmL